MDIYPVTLTGQIIRLVPLSESHCLDLTAAGNDESIWRYMLYGNIQTLEQMLSWVRDMLRFQSEGTDLPFAVIYLKSGRAVGATRYLNISSEHRHLEIGGTWYGVEYQGTAVNSEAKYLLLQHAFETLGCVRVQLKTDARNLRSQRAIERLGATPEGILRHDTITPDGYLRDSMYYSILDQEWPDVKKNLEGRLERY
ncbi:MAG: GNAT family N-acetyltransferase [Chloroflexi bacterium RBG_16_54_18]|nr:MAG: GNAT family N-acetyltransferase [Chloroflexi bacterium RBG_16_54_18]